MSKKTPRKARNAIMLFQRDTPFKPKVVKSKKAYTRKTKHKGKIL